MAYLTQTKISGGDEVDVWLASGGGKVATRIATFTGPILDAGRIGTLTPGVPDLLVSIGHSVAGAGASYCSDLYLLAPDGTSLKRLTAEQIGIEIGASRLSPDGSHMAFEATNTDPSGPTTEIVVGSASKAIDRSFIRGPCFDPVWSPDSQKVAVACTPTDTTSNDTIRIWDRTTGTWSATEMPVGTQADTIAWMSDSRDLVAITSAWSLLDGARQVDGQTLTVQSLDTRTGAWLVRARTTGFLTTYGENSRFIAEGSPSISPDRAHAIVNIYINKAGITALLDMKTGVVSALNDLSPIRYTGTWSLDSAKLIIEVSPPKLAGMGLQVQPLGGQSVFAVKLPDGFPDGRRAYAIEVP
jgi:Tol biopolymer transport system component